MKIADIKKDRIENIIIEAQKCKQISAIILLGLAFKEWCKDPSDIDMAIISQQTIYLLSRNKGFSRLLRRLTVWTFQRHMTEYILGLSKRLSKKDIVPICKELPDKGKVIYRRVS